MASDLSNIFKEELSNVNEEASVIAEFIPKNENDYTIKCKIVENLLYSDKPNLSSDEHKALYVDFMMSFLWLL